MHGATIKIIKIHGSTSRASPAVYRIVKSQVLIFIQIYIM